MGYIFLVITALTLFVAFIAKGAPFMHVDERTRRRQCFDAWHAALRAAGLDSRQLTATESRATGELDGASVNIELKGHDFNVYTHYQSLIAVESAHIPRSLSLRRDPDVASSVRWSRTDDVKTGDRQFDERHVLKELDAHVCAALGYTTRALLTPLLSQGVNIEGGKFIYRSDWSERENASLPQLLRRLAAIAQALSIPPEQVPQRLAQSALTDPAPDVRLSNLRYLVAPATNAPRSIIDDTVPTLLEDPHAAVRALAAQHAGVQGHPVLRQLVADASIELAVRIQAARALGQRTSPDLEGLRAALLDRLPPEVLCAALSVAGAHADADLRDAVLRSAASVHPSVRAEAAGALGVLADPLTEPHLILLLSDPDPDVQQASADALGAFGSIAAVEPLLPLTGGLMRALRVTEAARAAIVRIQGRLGDVDAGRLSLSESHELAGAVDIANAASAVRVGEVSLVEEGAPAELRSPPLDLRR
ncbi:MAG TPA: HEAT repeat domain-containing protein [Polyangiaceae bacterium]|nr:HEAT repeat domain-containing protein [Polyangiaceae bacterium]